ncbi:flagellar protein FlaG [Thalassobacillus pellis]|uniref:flagellar protein FlaG n=1 Tax=Thalassobacillus pellis TaxID=748008 RepID=UPI003B835438
MDKTLPGSKLLQQPSHTSSITSLQDKKVQTEEIKQTNEPQEEQDEIQKEKAKGIVEGLNEFLLPSKTSLKFEFHEKLDEYYVTLIDSRTKEVVKEIPPKRLLDIYAAMAEQLGFIVDNRI